MLIPEISLIISNKPMSAELMTSNGKLSSKVATMLVLEISASKSVMLA